MESFKNLAAQSGIETGKKARPNLKLLLFSSILKALNQFNSLLKFTIYLIIGYFVLNRFQIFKIKLFDLFLYSSIFITVYTFILTLIRYYEFSFIDFTMKVYKKLNEKVLELKDKNKRQPRPVPSRWNDQHISVLILKEDLKKIKEAGIHYQYLMTSKEEKNERSTH